MNNKAGIIGIVLLIVLAVGCASPFWSLTIIRSRANCVNRRARVRTLVALRSLVCLSVAGKLTAKQNSKLFTLERRAWHIICMVVGWR